MTEQSSAIVFQIKQCKFRTVKVTAKNVQFVELNLFPVFIQLQATATATFFFLTVICWWIRLLHGLKLRI